MCEAPYNGTRFYFTSGFAVFGARAARVDAARHLVEGDSSESRRQRNAELVRAEPLSVGRRNQPTVQRLIGKMYMWAFALFQELI